MSESLCTCGHLPHIFSCWGDNGECACREHAAPAAIKRPQPLQYDHMQVPVWPYRSFRRVGVSEWSCPDCERAIIADRPRDLLHLPCHEGYVAEPKALMPEGFQADLSSFSRDEHGVYYRPAEPNAAAKAGARAYLDATAVRKVDEPVCGVCGKTKNDHHWLSGVINCEDFRLTKPVAPVPDPFLCFTVSFYPQDGCWCAALRGYDHTHRSSSPVDALRGLYEAVDQATLPRG